MEPDGKSTFLQYFGANGLPQNNSVGNGRDQSIEPFIPARQIPREMCRQDS